MGQIRGLGYLRLAATDLAAWREVAVEALGMVETSGPEAAGLYLRLDERVARITVLPGRQDRVLAVGWEVRDQFALGAVARAAEAAGAAVRLLDADECRRLRVDAAISFVDPAGTTIEVFHGPLLDHDPMRTAWAQAFVTGASGMGSIALPVDGVAGADRVAGRDSVGVTESFYTEVLGFAPRGTVVAPSQVREADGRLQRVRLRGVNRRHHSLSLHARRYEGREAGPAHLMVEVDGLDAVGRALDEARRRGMRVSTLGRRTADGLVSFVVALPGGWQVEYGTGAAAAQDHSTVEELGRASTWGHDGTGQRRGSPGRDGRPAVAAGG